MKKFTLIMALTAFLAFGVKAEKVEPIKFGNFENWVTRVIKESGVIGGETKKVYEIAPNATINGAKAYHNMGGSQLGHQQCNGESDGRGENEQRRFPRQARRWPLR